MYESVQMRSKRTAKQHENKKYSSQKKRIEWSIIKISQLEIQYNCGYKAYHWHKSILFLESMEWSVISLRQANNAPLAYW